MADPKGLDFATLLASSVHDMKNSMGMLVHLVDEVGARIEGEAPALDRLRFEAARLNQGLVQLMSLYKLEQGQYRSVSMEYLLDEFVEDLVLLNRPVLQPLGIQIETRVSADLSWHFDGQLVTGVLGTVLGNLVRFDGDALRSRAERVCITAEVEGDYLRFCIEDSGEGYPEALLDDQASSATPVDFKSGSTGFGLYFSRQVAAVHRHGDRCGFVRLSNGGALGGGRFELYLP